jgi:hypothetical protein
LHVDHIIEHNNNHELFNNYGNLNTLCRSCHGIKSAQQQRLNSLSIGNYSITINDINNSTFNKYNSFYVNEAEAVTQVIKEIEITKHIIINTNGLGIDKIRLILYELILTIKKKPNNIKLIINNNRTENETHLLNILKGRG